MTSAGAYDLMTREFFVDPFPTLRRMREEAPVYFYEPLKIWLLTRYRDVDAVVRDPRFINKRAPELLTVMMPGARPEELEEMAGLWSRLLWFNDPPHHTKLRQFMNK